MGDASPDSAPRARKRKEPVTTSARLQPKALLAATRNELRDLQASLMEVAEARRALLAKDKRGVNSTIELLPPKV